MISLSSDFPCLRNTSDLSQLLGTSIEEIIKISNNSREYYHHNKGIPKDGGELRETFRITSPLKDIQKQIKEKVFWCINYPIYLSGGIKDEKFPRNYIEDVWFHTNAKTVATIDIKSFFPSIHPCYIHNIFYELLHCSNDVSDILTKLTTVYDMVPQGASTSSYLSNLLFWQCEPDLYQYVTKKGFTYSRYIDDITIFHKENLSHREWQMSINKVVAMFRQYDLTLNRKRGKISIKKVGQGVRIHGLAIASKKPTVPKETRNRLRAQIHNLVESKNSLEPDEILHAYQVFRGKLEPVLKLNANFGQKLLNDLNRLKE